MKAERGWGEEGMEKRHDALVSMESSMNGEKKKGNECTKLLKKR